MFQNPHGTSRFPCKPPNILQDFPPRWAIGQHILEGGLYTPLPYQGSSRIADE